MKIIICTCNQCKAQKRKKSWRNRRGAVARAINKKRRKMLEGEVFNFYRA